MYPFGRLGAELWRIRKLPPLGFFEQHQTTMRVYPWDLDGFLELNNGRTLTLYDIPRLALAKRCGLWEIMRAKKCGLTVAGSAVQYRKRIANFEKITMTAQCVGLDERFLYLVQNCYRDDVPCGQVLMRTAFVKNGIVSPREMIKDSVSEDQIPPLADWMKAYAKAADERPWPPEKDSL